MSSIATSYFIYYRTVADPADVRRVVGELQRMLAVEAGVRGRLMRRADDASTWMEIYESVADAEAFERLEAAVVERSGFARLLAADGRRQVERFVAA